jgi:hypothetical protein
MWGNVTTALDVTAAMDTTPHTNGMETSAAALYRTTPAGLVERHALHTVSQVSAILSMLGACSIVVTFFAFRSLQRWRGRKLIFFLSLCDFMVAFSYSIDVQTKLFTNNSVEWCQVC